MPPLDLRPLLQKSESESSSAWDLGNDVLYQLCATHSGHKLVQEVVAKIWLIGRSYAAAIERRRNKTKDELNDDFYVKVAAPAIIDSDIDLWLSTARAAVQVPQSESQNVLLETHAKTTDLFKSISKQGKRSLASKYLHFHVRDLYFIYDKRAVEAISQLSSIVGRATRSSATADNEYRKFVEKCVRLQAHLREEYNLKLTPRQLDKLLLEVHAR